MSEAVRLDVMAAGLARRGTPLTPESALFVVLEALEALGSRPLVLSATAVRVNDEGAVSLGEGLTPAPDETSVLEGALETLEAVLVPLPTSVTELAVRVRQGQVIARASMISELAALLVPLNRKAARRMLGRLVREHVRPFESENQPRAAPPHDVSEEAEASSVSALLTAAEPSAPPAEKTGNAMDTVLDEGPPSAMVTQGDDDPMDEWGEAKAADRARHERKRGLTVFFIAMVALGAAVVFLLYRLREAGH